MSTEKEMLLFVVAGLMNGSFVVSSKYVKNLTLEKVWSYHSIIGLAILPWIAIFLYKPTIFQYYSYLNPLSLLTIILGGFIFGMGQVCFAYAIEKIGIALSFTINLGLGIVLGSVFVLFYRNVHFSTDGLLVILSILIILIGLTLNYYSNINTHYKVYKKKSYQAGWILALVTGMTSGLQNITFIVVAFPHKHQIHHLSSFWVWPPFLLSASIPMFIGFLHRNRQYTAKLTNNNFNLASVMRNLLLIILMGVLFSGSLFIYSLGMDNLKPQIQVVGWPTFMVSIIITSQLWGWIYKESIHKKFLYRAIGTLLLIFAILILTLVT